MTTQNSGPSSEAHTPIHRFRAPKLLWEAYETVCRRVFQRDRSEDLVEHMTAVVREHGTPAELKKLAAAEQEIAERRSRKGGRPRKTESEA